MDERVLLEKLTLEEAEEKYGKPLSANAQRIAARNPKTGEIVGTHAHTWHPDLYHPDTEVRLEHGRRALQENEIACACGKRMKLGEFIVVTDADKKKPCVKCNEITKGAAGEHEKALEELTRRFHERRAKPAGEE